MTHLDTRDRRSEPVLLWDLDRVEHREWVRAGCGELKFDDYRAQLEEQRHLAEKEGRPWVYVRARVMEVIAMLREIGVVSSPAGCETALRSLYERGQTR